MTILDAMKAKYHDVEGINDARNISEALAIANGTPETAAEPIVDQISEDEEERVTLTELTYSGTLAFEQYEGIPFDPRGLTFTAHFSDGTTATVDPADLVMPTELLLVTTGVTPSYTYNGVTKRTTPIPITVTPTLLKAGGFRLAIRNSLSDMKCRSGTTISTGGSSGPVDSSTIRYTVDSRGKRRVACGYRNEAVTPSINGEVLPVTGGSTVHFTASPEGFTHPVDWSCTELDANGNYVTGGLHAEQWLTGDLTLQANTAYLMITFKATGDTGTSHTVNLSDAEIRQLPAAALTVYEPDDLLVYWNANGGVGEVGPVVHHVDNGGYNITMLDSDIGEVIYHPEGKTIVGWSATPDASSGSYLPSQTTRYVPSGNQTLPLTITFYAIWQ